MLCLPTRRSPRSAGRAVLAATLLAGAAIVGSAAPASAFVADSAWEDSTGPHHAAHGAHHRHAPSGANVIGRGIGGLHGQLSDAAAERTAIVR